MVISCGTEGICYKIASADLVAPLALTTCLPATSGVVCDMDVRPNGVPCMSRIAWLTCHIMDISPMNGCPTLPWKKLTGFRTESILPILIISWIRCWRLE